MRLRRQVFFFFFQAEDGIRDLVRSRGLGDVYKRQPPSRVISSNPKMPSRWPMAMPDRRCCSSRARNGICLLYTSDAADERSSVDLGGRRIIKKKNTYAKERRLNRQRTQR